MGVLIDFSERGGDVRRFDEGLKAAKRGLMEVCDIWEGMKQDFQQRGGSMGGYNQRGSYNERYNERYDQRGYDQRGYDQRGYDQRGYDQRGWDGPMMNERDWMELQERRRRGGNG